jgi:hypothetical protein
VKPSHASNDNLIDRTIALWQPRLRRDLSREDARQIAENVTGFFSILREWSSASVPAPYNENCAVSGSDEPNAPTRSHAQRYGSRRSGAGRTRTRKVPR